MDISRIRELEYQLTHRHKDGAFGVMEEVVSHHTAVDHDPERTWGGEGRLFKCTSCDEWAMIRKVDSRGRPLVAEDETA